MVIGHLSAYDDKSANGVIKVVYDLTREQVKQGHIVYVYGFKEGLSGVDTIHRPEGVILKYFPKGTKKNGFLSEMFLQYLRENPDGLDYFHFHSVYMRMNVVAAKWCSMPYIVTPHGGYALINRNRNLFTKIKKTIYEIVSERKYLRNALMIQTLSDFEKRELLLIFPELENQIYTIPNGTPDVLYQAEISNSGILRIGFIGRVAVYHKGLDLFMYGMAKYVRNGGKRAQVKIVGPANHDDIEQLKKIIQSNGLDNYVKLIGPLFGKEKEDFLKKGIDLFIHTSRWEGLPLSVLEALSYGIPVLVTKETNMAGYVNQYGAGWVLENSSAECINATLENILNEKNYKQKGINAKKLANQVFSWCEVTKMLSEQVQMCLNQCN